MIRPYAKDLFFAPKLCPPAPGMSEIAPQQFVNIYMAVFREEKGPVKILRRQDRNY